MAVQRLNGVLEHVRKMAAVQTYRQCSDGDLLKRFVAARDEAAFTVLIERHGSMVLAVCRRALVSVHDAEDACQAVFLVLARKAASIRRKASLSSWLHGVAGRVCVRLKRDLARRKNHERRANAPAPGDPAAEITWREVQGILDAELAQLPERYREPFILCYLECLPREEASQRLGVSSGCLHGRLERARDLLRVRLTRRGLTLAGVVSAAAVGESAAQAALAPTLVVSSIRAAALLSAGQPVTESVVSRHVLVLAQEVLQSMFLTKVKLGTTAVLCVGLLAALIGNSFTSKSVAQDGKQNPQLADLAQLLADSTGKPESDAEFIRRISKDLRGTEPTPAEIHFFVTSKDAGRRQKLIDLFIEERQAKKQTLHLGDDASKPAGPGAKKTVEFEVIRLRNATAAEVARVIDEVFNGPRKASPHTERIRVVADPATNSILLQAAPTDVLSVRRLLDSLDETKDKSGKIGN